MNTRKTQEELRILKKISEDQKKTKEDKTPTHTCKITQTNAKGDQRRPKRTK